ncbi:hypothetical protein PTKIN_Ptkin05aG0047800 [Pterospermum kingtungense]
MEYGAQSNGNAKTLGHGLKFLIYGRTGCIGGLLGQICEAQGIPFAYGSGRLENRESLRADIATVHPTHVFNAAGATGRPHVDWCEFNKIETIRNNVIGALNIADVCREMGLPLIFYSTGCMFDYDADHPMGSGIGFTENDRSNYSGSFFSKTKGMVEDLVKNYENVCILRVRMPLFSDLSHHRNFIKKIIGYERVVNIPNSMTVLDELLPISIEMAKRNLTGIWNFTNPGVLSHNEVLEMYRDYVDPNFMWKNFSLEEQAKVLAAPRCNNELDSTKLKLEFPEILPIKESVINLQLSNTDYLWQELYNKIGWPLYRKYGHAFEAFKIIVTDPDSVLNTLTSEVKKPGPDGQEVTEVVPAVTEEVKDALVKNIRRRMTPQPLKIRADVEMKCFQFDGVLHIKEAMRQAEAAGNDDCPVKIKLVAPPLYVLTTQTLDKEQGIVTLNKAIAACTEAIEHHKGKLVVKEQPRAVSERDDKLLAEHMAKLRNDNEEVSGDEDSEEEEDTGMGEVDVENAGHGIME